MEKLVTIASHLPLTTAHLMSANLEAYGIWSFVANENSAFAFASGGIKLQVRESDAEEARGILDMKE